jgi:hypothetical protein
LKWTQEGRVWQAGIGVLTTPESFAATTLVRQTPIFFIRVPAGRVIVPIMASVTPEATGAAVFEMLISNANNDIGTSNSVATTPVNTNTRYAAIGSSVQAYGTNTGATGTAPTGVSDLYRIYQQVDNDAITGSQTFPFIYDPFNGRGAHGITGSASNYNTFMVYAANGTSSTGFAIVTWAEWGYDEFYGLTA